MDVTKYNADTGSQRAQGDRRTKTVGEDDLEEGMEEGKTNIKNIGWS